MIVVADLDFLIHRRCCYCPDICSQQRFFAALPLILPSLGTVSGLDLTHGIFQLVLNVCLFFELIRLYIFRNRKL